MSDFYTVLDEMLGEAEALTEVRVVVRRLWFYDFEGFPTRLWQGKGKLYTSDGHEWLGTITQAGDDVHVTPAIQDGRDGTSATYTMSMNVPNFEMYEALKRDKSLAVGRDVTVYLAIFKEDEALRPSTPHIFFKQMTMLNPKFTEDIRVGQNDVLERVYSVSVDAKDNNFGRANIPGGTYADTIQKERSRQLGVTNDRGCEFLALLANRTYQIP